MAERGMGQVCDNLRLAAAHVPAAVVAVPRQRLVYMAGQLVARDDKVLAR